MFCCVLNLDGERVSPEVRARYAGRVRALAEGGWIDPCLSLGWQYADMPADLSALSLVVGLCVVNALRELGVGAGSGGAAFHRAAPVALP